MAADIVSGLTGSAEGVDKLKHVLAPLLTVLLRLVPDSNPDISNAALTALVNLSQDDAVGQQLLQMNVVNRVLEYVREQSCPHIELLVRAAFSAKGPAAEENRHIEHKFVSNHQLHCTTPHRSTACCLSEQLWCVFTGGKAACKLGSLVCRSISTCKSFLAYKLE
jgi:hypothetical protein